MPAGYIVTVFIFKYLALPPRPEDRPAGPAGAGGERLLCARVPADMPVESGDTVDLAMRPEALHYFAPADGARLPDGAR
ncbi:hypothetical protein AA958_27270 [Streptomyces sp. CNQ-509]|nr:hypothetical protein AA958_27270 [Streptomyces sp. CNQ-509]